MKTRTKQAKQGGWIPFLRSHRVIGLISGLLAAQQLLFFTLLIKFYDVIVLGVRPASKEEIQWYMLRPKLVPYEQDLIVFTFFALSLLIVLLACSQHWLHSHLSEKAPGFRSILLRAALALLLACALAAAVMAVPHVRLYMVLLPAEIYSIAVLWNLIKLYLRTRASQGSVS